VKAADIHLPYFKQGDDLGHHLSQSPTVEAAIEAHANQLEYTAQILRSIKEIIAGAEVDIQADTHTIMIEGPDEIIDALVDAKYASPSWNEDDQEGDYDDTEDSEDELAEGWDAIF
jgi:hypothetical protein